MAAPNIRWHPLAHRTVTPRNAAVAVEDVAQAAEARALSLVAKTSGVRWSGVVTGSRVRLRASTMGPPVGNS
jgi:hypothetical protein